MKVSEHAITRFRERTGCRKKDCRITKRLLDLFRLAQPAEFKNTVYETLALLNHDFERAEYFMYNDWVFVVVNDCIKTVHQNESNRWILK